MELILFACLQPRMSEKEIAMVMSGQSDISHSCLVKCRWNEGPDVPTSVLCLWLLPVKGRVNELGYV